MKNLENEVKSPNNRLIDTFLVIFVFLSFFLGITLYIYYATNSSYINELYMTKDIHSLRAEMMEFSDKYRELGYIEIKEVSKVV